MSYLRRHLYGFAMFATVIGVLLGVDLYSRRGFAHVSSSVVGEAEPTPQPSPDLDELAEVSPRAISLFVISHRDGDLTRLWKKLGIKTINISEHQQLDPKDFSFLSKCNSCKADEYYHELDGEPGHEVIVKVEDGTMQASRFLILKELDDPVGTWKLLGHIDSDLDKYRPSQHSVVATDAGPLLIVTSQGASGSGVAMYVSRVFAIQPTGIRQIMSYVAEGSQAGYFARYSRSFFGSLVSAKKENGAYVIHLSLSAKYFGSDPNLNSAMHLFTKTQKAVYSRYLKASDAHLLTHQSELTERELEDVYNIDSLSDAEFLRYNAKELEQIRLGNDEARKEWLQQFLDKCYGRDEC